MRGQRAVLILMAAVLVALGAGGAAAAHHRAQPRYHYEVRRDLSVYFTNSDKVIESIRSALRRRTESFTVTYEAAADSTEDIPALIRDLMGYALSETDDPKEGDYIYSQYGGYDLSYRSFDTEDGHRCEVTVRPRYYTTAEQEAQVDRAVEQIVGEIGADGSDADKARAVYEYLRDNVTFDLVHEKNGRHTLKATAYAALIQKSAVCQGYSAAAYRLLRELGVNARVITGLAGTGEKMERHSWNIVEVGGRWYNMDVTWASVSGEELFLLSDEELTGHIRDEEYASESFAEAYPMSECSYVF